MRQITLRGMDPEVERKIRRMAKTTGKSLNRVILDMLHQYTGLNKKNKNLARKSPEKNFLAAILCKKNFLALPSKPGPPPDYLMDSP